MTQDLEVEPAALRAAGRWCDEGAQTAAGVVRSLRGAGVPDTGRGDSRAAVAALMDRLDRAVVGLGEALSADADALRGSAGRYTGTDDAIARP